MRTIDEAANVVMQITIMASNQTASLHADGMSLSFLISTPTSMWFRDFSVLSDVGGR